MNQYRNYRQNGVVASYNISNMSGYLRYLKLGFHTLVLFLILNAFFPSQGASFQKIGINSLFLLSVIFFSIQMHHAGIIKQFKKIRRVSRLLASLLIVWFLIVVFRGVELETSSLFTLIANPEIGGLVWLLPFFILVGTRSNVLNVLLPVFKMHAMLGAVLIIWTIFDITFFNTTPSQNVSKVGLTLIYGAPIVLLAGLGTQSDKRLYYFTLVLSAIAHFMLSQRAGFAMILIYIILSLALGRAQRLKSISFRLVLVLILVSLMLLLGIDYMLSRLSDDWLLDTRSFLIEEMSDDFTVIDWLFGRGALGTYFSPYFAHLQQIGAEGGDFMYRQVNEIGYLHIALKAGLIGVVLYILTIAKAINLSISYPNKRIGVGVVLLLSLHLIEMLIIGQATFQPARIMLWILVGVVSVKQYENIG